MADEVLEPPVKRLKLHQEDHIGHNSDMIKLSENTSVENTSTNSDDVPGTSKDNTNEENMILEKSTEDEIDNSDNLSEISDLSGLSEESWKPTSGAMVWIHKQIVNGVNPRSILKDLIPDDTLIPDNLDDFTLWKIAINILSEPPPRKKLSHINTLQDVLHLLQTCQNIMVLTGAGVSVSCGIPDFRSRDGIYARLAVDFPDLPDPQAMFDISYFRNDPRPFFKFAKEIYPGQFEPSSAHKFINTIEKKDKLLRNYTQNIDTLEQVAGISKVIHCHGSFATATCMMCKHKVDAEVVREDIFNQVIPKCPICPSNDDMAIMKPDIVFFGESLSDEFHKHMTEDKDKCDLLIVIGSSLKVRPVALIPSSLPEDVPQILINREPLKHLNFDVELLGDCDTIVEELCKNLNWDNKSRSPVLQEISKCELKTPTPSELGEDDDTTASSESDTSAQSADDKIYKGSAENLGSVHCHSTNESLNDQSCNKRNISELNDEIECNDQSEHDTDRIDDEIECNDQSENDEIECNDQSENYTDRIDAKDCCVDTFKGNNQSNNCVLTNADDKHIVVFKDKETSAKTTCQNGDEPNYLKCSSQVQSAAVVDTDNDKTNESSNENGDVRRDESLPSTSNTADLSNDARKSVISEDSKTSDEDDLEVTRNMWKPHHHSSMAKRLGEKQYLFLPPNRYVFSGAEVYSDMDNDDSEEDSDNSSYSSTSDDELESIVKDDEKTDSVLKDDGKTDSESIVKDDEKKDYVVKDDKKKDSVVKDDERKDSVVKDDEKKNSESHVCLVNDVKEDLMYDKSDLCLEDTEGQDLNSEINGSDIIYENTSCTNHCNGSSSSISHCEPEPISKINGGMHQDYDELEQIDTSLIKERINKKNIPNGTIDQHLN